LQAGNPDTDDCRKVTMVKGALNSMPYLPVITISLVRSTGESGDFGIESTGGIAYAKGPAATQPGRQS